MELRLLEWNIHKMTNNISIKQFVIPPLDRYLSRLEEPFLCTGDFNIHHSRMNTWFKNFSIENITNTKLPLWNVSIIYTNKKVNGFGDVDHIIYGKGVNILSSAYDWTFLSFDETVYPNVDGIFLQHIQTMH